MALDEDTELLNGGVMAQVSATFDDGIKIRFLGLSLTDAATDLNESIPKGEVGVITLEDEL